MPLFSWVTSWTTAARRCRIASMFFIIYRCVQVVELQLATEAARLLTRYNTYAARFFDIFKLRDLSMPTFFLPGNHDLGCVMNTPCFEHHCESFGPPDSEKTFPFLLKLQRGTLLTLDHGITRLRLATILFCSLMQSPWSKKILSAQTEGFRMKTGLQ
jgi:hypothetical protein